MEPGGDNVLLSAMPEAGPGPQAFAAWDTYVPEVNGTGKVRLIELVPWPLFINTPAGVVQL
jgi:hypothetical protein